MKKKIIATIFLSIVILIAAGVTFIPRKTEAQALLPVAAAITKYAAATAVDNWVDSLLADVGEGIMRIQGYFLSLTGLLLNISIVLTMNIKAIYQATPAIESTWIVIRNLSSIFIIFALLYTSILTILDQGGQKLSQLVKNIVIAGLLINFSLFFTKLAIDASNLVSLQFYRAIVPNSQQMLAASGTNGRINWSGIISSSYSTGGISNVFMQALQIPRIYNVNTGKTLLNTTNSFGNKFRIAVSTIVGTIIMVIASLSFLAMAIAFTIRIVILLLLMGFSPIYFVGMIFPEIKKDLSDKWFKWLKEQLIFMPVYLLFMYVAMSFLTTINPDQTKSFFGALSDVQLQAGGASSNSGILLASVGLLFQYSIALILMIIPLFAAKEIGGGLSTKWGIQAKDWFTEKVKGWATAGAKGASGFVGRNTLGAAASRVSESGAMRALGANSPFLGRIAQGGLSKVSGAGFGGKKGGYDAQIKADRKAMEALDKKIGTVNRYDFAEGKEGDAAFDAAKKEASKYQADYRQNLANRSLINKIINGRAGQASAAKLIKDAKKEAAKKNKGKNEEELTKKRKKLEEIDTKLNNPLTKLTVSDNEIERLKKERSDVKEDMARISKEIDDAKEAERDDIIGMLKKEDKDEDGEKKSGGKKDDKK